MFTYNTLGDLFPAQSHYSHDVNLFFGCLVTRMAKDDLHQGVRAHVEIVVFRRCCFFHILEVEVD